MADQDVVSGDTNQADRQEQAWPRPREAWYAVAIFALALMVNFLDRGILALLIQPIKNDLDLSDTEVSLIIGFAFVIFYVFLGLPIARLVDTKSRRLIIGICIAIWSGMTAMCGFAQNFTQLFLCRVGVGVGEAGNGPATYSMLSDLFPKDKLPRAISVLNFGFVAGNGIALIIGGLIVKMLADMPEITVPYIGTFRSWQLALIMVGLPGLLIAGLMATVKEPVRRGIMGQDKGGPPKTLPIKQVLAFLGENWKTYAPMTLGMAFKAVLNFGNAIWLPTLFLRKYDWAISKIGVIQGTLMVLIAPFGLMAGSYLAEWLARKGRDDANVLVVIISALIVIPLSVAFPLMPTPELCLVLYSINTFFLFLVPGPQNAALQIITPNQIRGQVTALWLFVFNVVGFGLGPTFIALMTDFVLKDENRLDEALSFSSGILGVLAVLLLWYGLKPYAESVRRARNWD